MRILAMFILLFLVVGPVFAQQEPLTVPVDFPLPGQLEVVIQGPEVGNTSYGLLDTQTGVVTPLTPTTQSFMSFSPDFSSAVTIRNQDIVLMRTNDALTRSLDEAGRVIQTFSPQERVGVSWSGDGQSLLKTVFSESTSTYRFEIYTLETGAVQTIASLPTEAVERALNTTLNRSDIRINFLEPMAWNWRYPEWIAVHLIGIDAGMFNIVTHEYISFQTVFSEPVLSELSNWSADGTKLAMSVRKSITGGGAAVVFTLDSAGNPKLRLLSDADTSNYEVIFRWLGVGDLLFTGVSAANKDDRARNHIAQMIDGNWHEQLLFTASDRTGLGLRFHFTGTPEEEAALSCMFWDEVYPPHLKAGARGRVTFTDGTPSRLRADHSAHAAVVTQMAEGTTFEVTGASYCVDNYRWWPLRLDDGTVGWAAEGNPSEYWLEPVE